MNKNIYRHCAALFIAASLSVVGVCRALDSPKPTSSLDQRRAVEAPKAPVDTGLRPPLPAPALPVTAQQNWQANQREPAGAGFGVTQPGPIQVTVKSQGAVAVALIGPAGRAVQQQAGSGEIRLSYSATPADVQAGVLWRVAIDVADKSRANNASGTVIVQSPPADANAVQAKLQSLKQRPAVDAQAATRLKAAADSAHQQRAASFEQQQVQRRAALYERIRPQVEQLKSASGSALARNMVAANRQVNYTRGSMASGSSSSSSSSSQGSTGSQSSGGGTSTPPPAVAPTITGLSVQQGQPLDPVIVNGSGFGNQPGEVHFLVAPGKDVAGAVNLWGDGQIFVTVPDVSGIASSFNGIVYVVRADKQKSAGSAFHFDPALEVRELPLPPAASDSHVQNPDSIATASPQGWRRDFGPWSVWANQANFFGYKGNDEFYASKRLKNGWVMHDAQVVSVYQYGNAGAYIWDAAIGSDTPKLNVRVWEDAFAHMIYTYHVWVRGPKGVPYE